MFQMGDMELDPSDIEIAIETCNDKVCFTVFVKGYDESCKRELSQLVFIMLDHIIGEYDMVTKVGFIDFKPFEEESVYMRHSLENLPRIFDEFMER